MKKLLTVVALGSAIMLTIAGCGQKPAVQQLPQQGQNQQIQRGQGANFNTPEGKLRRELSSLQRLQRGDAPLSKDQISKLVLIINDIKSKDSIDQAYADQQSTAIQAILTDTQKTALNTRPQRPNNRQQGSQGQNGQVQGQQNGAPNGNDGVASPDQQNGGQRGNGGTQRGNWNGQPGNGQQGGGQQASLKDLCTRILDAL